jgi:hypothetical protein
MSRHQSHVHQNTLEFPLSTQPNHTPIHLLTHAGTPTCGARHFSRGWQVCVWPVDATLWPDLCVRCWDTAHAPAVRLQKEVA